MTLAAKTIGAVKSNYAGTLVRIAAQFFAQLIIMRQLGPELVGTFGYNLLLYGVMALIIDQGFGWALIQGQFEADEVSVVLSRVMLGSVLGGCLVYAMSYPLSVWLHSPLAGEMFRYSAPSYLLIAVFGISHAKLRAELRFREIQYATTGAYLIAYPLVGVGMALAGYGMWALLGAWYAQAILQFAIGYYFYPHSLRLGNPLRPIKAGPLGRSVASINVLNWAVDNSSGVVAGALGAGALGNFNAASMLSRTPALQLAQTLQVVLFSTASAVGRDAPRIKRLYLGAVASIAFVVIPAYGYALTHAHWLISLLFGNKWLQAAPVFSAMSVGMVALSISTLSGAILTAIGGQQAVLRSQFFCLVLMLLGLYLALDYGLVALGLVISGAYLVRLALQTRAIARSVGIGGQELLGVVRGPLVLALVLAVQFSPLYVPGGNLMMYEALSLPLKLLVVVGLLKAFPHFFICPALYEVMLRFGAGRRLAAWFGR